MTDWNCQSEQELRAEKVENARLRYKVRLLTDALEALAFDHHALLVRCREVTA
ncbi:MAG: hypothetical protein ACREB9_00265 [Thermoplasmata archaeon]